MLDGYLRKHIDPPLNLIGRTLANWGIPADLITVSGAILGGVAAICIALGHPAIALIPILFSRLADGLDGAVARASTRTDFGGYFDIVCDFFFYGIVPLGFVCLSPTENGVAGMFLLVSFYVNGASFLGYAVLAEKRGLKTSAQGVKSLYYANGLLEGAETIIFFCILCLFPAYFVPLAWIFGSLCFLTAILRISAARKIFR